MDTKGLQNRRHPKKMKSSNDNGKQEVFVLPPDLLKKLGISIGNVNVNQEIPVDVNFPPSTETLNDPTIANSSNGNENSSDTSILETANLMKKSVFLSPTFVSTTTNAIAGEVEILSKSNEETRNYNANIVEADNFPDVALQTSHTDNQVEMSCDLTVNGVFTSLPNINQDYSNKTSSPNGIKENENQLENSMYSILDDTSKSIAINAKESTDVLDGNINNCIPVQKLPGKINVISEETVSLSKLKNLKSLHSLKTNTLIPITVNTIIDNKYSSDSVNFKETVTSDEILKLPVNDTDVLHSQLDVAMNKENTDESNTKTDLFENDVINAAPSLPSQEMNCNKNVDISINMSESVNSTENKQKPEDTGELYSTAIKAGKTTFEKRESPDKDYRYLNENKMYGAVELNQMKERSKTLDDISLNATAVDTLKIKEIYSAGEKDNYITSNHVYNGNHHHNVEVEVQKNHSNIKNKTDFKKDNAEKPCSSGNVRGFDINTPIKGNLQKNNNDESVSNQITVAIVNSERGKKKKTKERHGSKIAVLKNTKDLTSQNDELTNILNVTKELSSSSTNYREVDKVKEIAAYLKKFSHIYTDKNKVKKEKIHLNTNTIKSKLSIQGVEKPGGNSVHRDQIGECKVLKTYARRNQQKRTTLSTDFTLHKSGISDTIDAFDYTLDTTNDAPYERQTFCSCFDFGRLTYYDNDSIYEHIHFWQHSSADCNLDLIFGIYNDEAIPNSFESVDLAEKTEEKENNNNFCWNVFQINLAENVDNPYQEHIHDSVIDGLTVCLGDSPIVPELNNIAASGSSIVLKTINRDHMMINNKNSDILLELVNHDIVATAENKNTDIVKQLQDNAQCYNSNNSAAVITAVDSADILNKDKNLSIPDAKITRTSVSPQQSNNSQKVFDKASSDQQEYASNTKEKSSKNNIDLESNILKIPQDKGETLDSPKTIEKCATKRRLSQKTKSSKDSNDEPSSKKNIKCGICNYLFSEVEWDDHVTNQHDLIAWRAGYTINLDHPELLNKLNLRLKVVGVLKCSLCNTEIKNIKTFIVHVKNCIKQKNANSDKSREKPTRKSRIASRENVKCGVCQKTMSSSSWLDHTGREHNYLAWSDGQKPLNLNDESVVWQHLQNIIRLHGCLTCYKCGLNRSRVKLYLSHIQKCDGSGISLDDSSLSVDVNSTSSLELSNVEQSLEVNNVKCGVCKQDVINSKWIEHIAKEHNYLAWQDGATPLNVDDEEDVWNHLQQFIRQHGGLFCCKCGLNRRRVKLYLAHIETCDGTGVSLDDSFLSVDLNSTSNVEIVDKSNLSIASDEKTVQCGVCEQKVTVSKWVEHIGKEHNYLAWQDGDTPLDLDNEEALWQHLQQIIRYNDGLICYKCGLHRKRAKLYLSHVKTCDGSEGSNDHWFEVPVISEEKKIIKCGVCSQEVSVSEWTQHIGKEHNYLAWEDGSSPLDLEDESAVRLHLLNISRHNNGLVCNKCEKNIKYPKTFVQHVKECTGVAVCVSLNKSTDSANTSINEISFIKDIKTETVTCGVCENTIKSGDWVDHLQKEHQYLAWIDGQSPVDVNDAAMVQKHLNDVSKMLGGLKCPKCGMTRKYVKTYLQHIDSCDGSKYTGDLPPALMNQDLVECAMCAEKIEPKNWKDHAMKKHYNIAWVVGDTPIELNNPYAVESFLKEYVQKQNKLVCKICGISRVSYVGFYAHIIICGKTDEETEMYKSVCDICHNKYLRIYKSQHMTAHREQEYALERKLLVAKEKELKKEEPMEVIQSGRRKAAEKAKTVIEKYKNNMDDGDFHCSKCGFSSEIEKELSDHICVEHKWGDASDSDESVKLEPCSDDDTDESDIDSNVSDEEREAREQMSYKKKRYSDPSSGPKTVRIPFEIQNANTYMKRSTEEFVETYLTDDDLFPEWRSCELQAVLEDEIVNYMPPIEQSCKLRFDKSQDWETINRFECKRERDTLAMFVGASVQCVAWAPSHVESDVSYHEPQYLAVTAHLGADVPRYSWDHNPTSKGLIQIWDLGSFVESMPQFVLGLAHDYGTVWAIDWCPSGARDLADTNPEPEKIHRLGLLVAACSNGSAYIFAVPYPSSIAEKDKLLYKIKPVVELRLAMSTDRKEYQATAVKWSVQRGHSHIVVGYSDGTTAFFDLKGKSPLLMTTENNVTVFYPYHDERVQNSCIEDLDMYPSGSASAVRGGGVVCVSGAGGAGAGPLQSHVASARIMFPPHWPAALLAGDDCLVTQSVNELEWWGQGRRLGGARGVAGCLWCGRVVTAALPLLRVMKLHPCFGELQKQVIRAIQMTPLAGKRKRQTDELAMIVEPITYPEVVNKYGIEFTQIVARDRTTQQKLSAMPRDAFPERFPLSDVTAMQFCPTSRHHHKLALAIHAGIVFIINV